MEVVQLDDARRAVNVNQLHERHPLRRSRPRSTLVKGSACRPLLVDVDPAGVARRFVRPTPVRPVSES
jgi:hypothetical protein